MDYGKWGNVAQTEAVGIKETGPGLRRQWNAKGDRDLLKVANLYPKGNLGIDAMSQKVSPRSMVPGEAQWTHHLKKRKCLQTDMLDKIMKQRKGLICNG